MATAHEFAMALRGAYLFLHRRANAVFDAWGTTADQFVLLSVLTEEDGVTQKALVDRCFSDPSTMRAMLVLLEKRGLIAREAHAEDGRARCVTLTGAGRRLQRTLAECCRELHDELLSVLPAEDEARVLAALHRVAAVMAPDSYTTPPRKELAPVSGG